VLKGIAVQELTPSLRDTMGIPEIVNGVAIANISEGCPAAQEALQIHDIILEVNRMVITNIGYYEQTVSISSKSVACSCQSTGAGLLENSLRMLGFSAPATPLPSLIAEKTSPEFLLAAIMVIVVALAEETIFRGYLILRFKKITVSTASAVLISAVIFSLGHGYEGSAGVITVGVMGVVFALVYIWRGSLVAPVVMHFLQDFVGIVLSPLLGMR
jgi:Type II CAAX prenyl endopeptidase Rce1-like/PDZ domain